MISNNKKSNNEPYKNRNVCNNKKQFITYLCDYSFIYLCKNRKIIFIYTLNFAYFLLFIYLIFI